MSFSFLFFFLFAKALALSIAHAPKTNTLHSKIFFVEKIDLFFNRNDFFLHIYLWSVLFWHETSVSSLFKRFSNLVRHFSLGRRRVNGRNRVWLLTLITSNPRARVSHQPSKSTEREREKKKEVLVERQNKHPFFFTHLNLVVVMEWTLSLSPCMRTNRSQLSHPRSSNWDSFLTSLQIMHDLRPAIFAGSTEACPSDALSTTLIKRI